jgi:hypothetical protein
MSLPSSTVVVRPLHPLSPNCLHMPTVGSTVQLFAFAYDVNGVLTSPMNFTWSSLDASVATVSNSGLVTGIANGITTIKATAIDSGAAVGTISVGVALLSANTISLAHGSSTTISSVGGFTTANWCSGAPGAAEVRAGTRVSGFIANSADPGTGWNPGPTATIFTPIFQGTITSTATATVPIFASVGISPALPGGIYCMATATITNVPNWAGN